MPGKHAYGDKLDTLAGTTETLDLRKTSRVFVGTVTGTCNITLSNVPLGYTELTFILTNPHTNFDIVDCLWVGGTKTLTQTGLDILIIGVYRTGSTVAIYEIGKSLAVAAN